MEKTILMDRIRLLLIDEVHLLNEPRGAHIETIVSRLRSRIVTNE